MTERPTPAERAMTARIAAERAQEIARQRAMVQHLAVIRALTTTQ